MSQKIKLLLVSLIVAINVNAQKINTVLPNPVIPGQNIFIPFDFETSMNSSNLYAVELSDNKGSFSNSTIIDTFSSSLSVGERQVTIPSNQILGAGYRIRMTSTSPALVSKPNNENIYIVNKYSILNDSIAFQWNKTYGGSLNDLLSAAEQTKDMGYMLSGSSISPQDSDKTQASQGSFDFWILKTDSNGNKLWDKRYGGADVDYLTSSQQTFDGGYILGGYSSSSSTGDLGHPSNGNYDYWIVKIDSLGNKEWDQLYGGFKKDSLAVIQQTSDGGYIVGGSSLSGISTYKKQASLGNRDYWVLKLDSVGNIIWEKRYGGASEDILTCIQQTKDGCYIMGGHSKSDTSAYKSERSYQYFDYWILKIDSIGNKIWDKTIGGYDDVFLSKMVETETGDFVLGGSTEADKGKNISQFTFGYSDYWVVKINKNGTKLWDKRYGGSSNDFLSSLKSSTDGGFFLNGTSYSPASGTKSQSARGSNDYWVLKIDSIGNVKWERTIGGLLTDNNFVTFQTVDGGFLSAGHSASNKGLNKSQNSKGANDYWMIKTKPSYMAYFKVDLDSQCLGGNKYNFTSAGNKNGNYEYHWHFGEFSNDTSSVKNPSKVYSDSGSYIVQLTVIESHGLRDSMELNVYVRKGSKPQIQFSFNDTIQCIANNQFTVTNYTTGATNFIWDFKEGYLDTTSVKNPSKTYNSVGTYVITLKASNGSCVSYASQNLKVNPSPTAGFLYISKYGTNYAFTDTSKGANKYNWNFGSGINDTSTLKNPNKDFNQFGNYLIRQIVTNTYNCHDTFYAQISKKGSIYKVLPNVVATNKNIHVYYDFKGANFQNNNMFRIQLSDSAGNFTKAIVIDTTYSKLDTGVLIAQIPYNISPGSGYRVRILSSNPLDTSYLNSENILIIENSNAFKLDTLYKQWDRTYGGGSFDGCKKIIQTIDGGYLACGYSKSTTSGDKTATFYGGNDCWLVKMDSIGNKQWDKSFGTGYEDYINAIQQTQDRGYIIGGYLNFSYRGKADYWILKIDSTGNFQWQKYYGGSEDDILNDLKVTADGGYIATGYSKSPISGDKSEANRGSEDYWVVKLNARGELEWDKTIGGNWFDYSQSIEQTIDGGYIVGGYSISDTGFDKTQIGNGGYDYWIIKLNKNGTKKWDKTYGGYNTEYLTTLKQTKDKGYILAGHSISGIGGNKSQSNKGVKDFWVVKITEDGTFKWDKTYGGNDEDIPYSINELADSNYIISGTTLTTQNGDITEVNRGYEDYWIVKVDQNGNKIWDKVLGGSNSDYLFASQQTMDGGFVYAGESKSSQSYDKTEASRGAFSSDYWIVKVGFIELGGFKVDKDIQCLHGNSFNFSYTGKAATNFLWNFGESVNDTSSDKNPNKKYTNAGKYYVTFTAKDTLGNSVTSGIYVTVNSSIGFSINKSICNGGIYSFAGKQLTSSGIYYDSLTNTVNCDSIVKLTLVVYNTSNFTLNKQICSGKVFNFNGKNISTSGIYIDTLSNSHGCDSIVTLNLSVLSQITIYINDTICSGKSYLFAGKSYSKSGIYTDTTKSYGGCDSVTILKLFVSPKKVGNINAFICSGDSYTLGKNKYTTSGTYTDTITTSSGCDSVVTLKLTVSNSTNYSINASICFGDSFELGNKYYYVSSTYFDTLTNSKGCDSIIQLNLTVNSLPNVPVITWNGFSLISTQANSYQWYLNLSPIAGATAITYNPSINGDYLVEIKDKNGCKNKSNEFKLTNIGFEINQLGNNISIYPNPTSGELNIINPNSRKFNNIYITDMNGKLILNLLPNLNSYMLPELSQGIYLLHIDEQVFKWMKM